jgi:hypothetical protein
MMLYGKTLGRKKAILGPNFTPLFKIIPKILGIISCVKLSADNSLEYHHQTSGDSRLATTNTYWKVASEVTIPHCFIGNWCWLSHTTTLFSISGQTTDSSELVSTDI